MQLFLTLNCDKWPVINETRWQIHKKKKMMIFFLIPLNFFIQISLSSWKQSGSY